jgi:DNA repair exonuclease SbcCD ATPase subunit
MKTKDINRRQERKAMSSSSGNDIRPHNDPERTRSNNEPVSSRAGLADQPPAGNNVDKIRDILFGSQMRDYDTRFARLEETLLKESSDLRETTRKRLDALEGYIKKELESLSARLKSEREERSTSFKQLSKDLKDLGEDLSQRIGELQDHSSEAQAELRKEILEQSKNLADEIYSKEQEITSLLERRFQELRNDKTDRSTLASLLTEVALRLNNEFRIPSTDD